MKNYVEIAYQKQEKPFGKYPFQLAAFLAKKYHLKKGMTILDNGCGRGEFMDAFSRLGIKASGTDTSDYCKKAKVVDLNQDPLPFPDNYFDVVFSKSVMEHIENTEHYLSEMKRVLRPGGVLILMVPDWETQYKIFYQDPTHIHPYTVKSVERLLEMFEFKNVETEKFIQLPGTWNNRLLRLFSRIVGKIGGPVNKVYQNKFIRFSRELMVLGSGVK